MVCPSSLEKGLHAAIDNIVWKFDVARPNHFKLEKDANYLPNLTLSKSYSDIMPLIGGQPKCSFSKLPQQASRATTHIEAPARKWINAVIGIEQRADLPITRKTLFYAFHAAMYRTSRPCRDISALIPLLNESINSPAIVAHCFKVISKVVKELNPSNHHSSLLINQLILLQNKYNGCYLTSTKMSW